MQYQGKLLGKAQLWQEGGAAPIKLRSKRLFALLAYLAESGQPVSRAFLIDLLWTEERAPDAKPAFRVMLSKLRQKMPDVLLSEGNQLSLQHIDWDTQQVMACLDKADEASLEQAQHAFQPFMLDFDFDASEAWYSWLEQRRLHWLDTFASINRQLFALYLQQGKHSACIHMCEGWLTLDPWREEAHEHYLQALLSEGREEMARVHLKRYADQHQQEFAIPIAEHFHALVAPKISKTNSTQNADAYQHSSPVNPFFGREHELVTLRRMSREHRLVTLVGMGGSGKTRLAQAFAQQQAGIYPDGIAFIALDASDSSTFVSDIASALGITQDTKPKKQLRSYFQERNMLLILDNMEHLIDHADTLHGWLEHAPTLHILATSRRRLNIVGEQLLQLTGLRYPKVEDDLSIDEALLNQHAQHYSALRFFEYQARLLKPDFVVQQHLPAVLGLLELLEGIPLAIELAASWLNLLSLPELTKLLSEDISQLSVEAAGVPQRHRSLQASLQVSWQQLSAQQQDMLTALAIFQGGFATRAALAVTAAPLNSLLELSYSSLLQRQEERFYWHPLVRQFVEKKLATSADYASIKERYIDYYLQFAQSEMDYDDDMGREKEALATIDREISNIRYVFELLHETEDARGFALADTLTWYWRMRNYYLEGKTLLARLLTYPEPQESKSYLYYASAYRNIAMLAVCLGEYEDAKQWCLEGLEHAKLLDDHALLLKNHQVLFRIAQSQHDVRTMQQEAEIVLALCRQDDPEETSLRAPVAYHNLALALKAQGDFENALSYYKRALELDLKLGDQNGAAFSEYSLGHCALAMDNLALAHQYFYQAQQKFEDVGNLADSATVIGALALIALIEGNDAKAKVQAQESLKRCQRYKTQAGACYPLLYLAAAESGLGNTRAAHDLFFDVFALCRKHHYTNQYKMLLDHLAQHLQRQGQAQQAAILIGAVEVVKATHAIDDTPLEQKRKQQLIASLPLDDVAFLEAFSLGKALSLDELETMLAGILSPLAVSRQACTY